MDKVMNKAIILSRVSSSPQDIEQQTAQLKAYAASLGYDTSNQIVIETVESAIKLSEEERQGLNMLKWYIENDSIDCVICWEPSRISRQQKTLYSIRDYLLEHKIQLYILNPFIKLLTDDRTQFDTTANIAFSIYCTLSENEMSIKASRFARAKSKLRNQGKKFAGATIFGYQKDKDKNCVPHPLYSTIVVALFNKYLDNDYSLVETYKWAAEQWPQVFDILEYRKMQSKIKHILNNTIYRDGNWCYPALIDTNVFDKVQTKLKASICRSKYGSKRNLLCRGKIYCGHCGNKLVGCCGNVNAYVCSTDKLHSLQMSIKAADWLMWHVVTDIVNIAGSVDNVQTITQLSKTIEDKKVYIGLLNDTIAKLEIKQVKLLDLYMDDTINKETYLKRNKTLDDQIRVYKHDIDNISIQIQQLEYSVKSNVVKAIDINNIDDFDTKMDLVRQYINKMTLYKEDKTIYIKFSYRMPLVVPDCTYLYKHGKIYRQNYDGTLDWIY